LWSLIEITGIAGTKSQYPNPKFQIISNPAKGGTKFRNKSGSVIRNSNLDIVWDLACLREAASAKAGACYLVLLCVTKLLLSFCAQSYS
jgi:hypothetical protein